MVIPTVARCKFPRSAASFRLHSLKQIPVALKLFMSCSFCGRANSHLLKQLGEGSSEGQMTSATTDRKRLPALETLLAGALLFAASALCSVTPASARQQDVAQQPAPGTAA